MKIKLKRRNKLVISELKGLMDFNSLIVPNYSCQEIKGGNGIPPDGDIRG